jgi:2-polyprenyl-3-methyl-5-hydroxy-6-metoxy-1,4-benzoquinol methylase
MLILTNCPICDSTEFDHIITCNDYTVSQNPFNIVGCKQCSFRFTNPRPTNDNLPDFYKSINYISHSDTKKGFVSQVYHLVRKYTLNQKLKLLIANVAVGNLLDYGCGTGMFLKQANAKGWNSFGTEPDEGARELSNSNKRLAFENKKELNAFDPLITFNAITLWHVLEHVTDLPETLEFFMQKLNPNGALIIAVPNYNSYDAKHYKAHWAAYDLPRHLYHFEAKTISQLLAKYGFALHETYPMKFDSFYVSMLSEKYLLGRINYFKAFLIGLRSNLKAKKATDYSSVIYVFKHA